MPSFEYPMSNIFRFKQFSIDQTGCAMKVNTDGVLLGALITVNNPTNILEIGAGTGVISLMMAQKYRFADIDAIEIEEAAALTANLNFHNSNFQDRLRLIKASFQEFFLNEKSKKYDLILSNPPYFINSLKSASLSKGLARHTGPGFFDELITGAAARLSEHGSLWLILPVDTLAWIFDSVKKAGLRVQGQLLIHSFPNREAIRCILTLGFEDVEPNVRKFVIYERQNYYSNEYRALLKDYLTIF